jgi:hypothetical protein
MGKEESVESRRWPDGARGQDRMCLTEVPGEYREAGLPQAGKDDGIE